MTAPAIPFTKTDQTRLRQLKLECSQMPQPGRVIFWRGHRLLGHGDVSKLGNYRYVPEQADTICVSPADYDDVRAWLG